jgi:hypothetical protein
MVQMINSLGMEMIAEGVAAFVAAPFDNSLRNREWLYRKK